LKQWAKLNSDRITKSVIPGFPYVPDAPLRLDVEGDGWGWNLGALWKPHPKHSVGFNYRSQARLAFKGHVNVEDLEGPVMLAIFGGKYYESAVNTDITLPPQVTIGYSYQITKKWEAEVDLGITGWSVFNRQEFMIGNPNPVMEGLSPIAHGYHESISLHVGSDYALSKYLSLRAGYFFYQTPSKGGHLGPVIPDGNRHGFSTGFSINFKSISIDLAYIAEIFADHKAKETDVGVKSGVVADGTYSSFLNLFAFNVTYRFGDGAPEKSGKWWFE
jgi:long-chain fatty acid transport protein